MDVVDVLEDAKQDVQDCGRFQIEELCQNAALRITAAQSVVLGNACKMGEDPTICAQWSAVKKMLEPAANPTPNKKTAPAVVKPKVDKKFKPDKPKKAEAGGGPTSSPAATKSSATPDEAVAP